MCWTVFLFIIYYFIIYYFFFRPDHISSRQGPVIDPIGMTGLWFSLYLYIPLLPSLLQKYLFLSFLLPDLKIYFFIIFYSPCIPLISSFIPHPTLILFTSLLPLPSHTHTPPFHPFFLYIHSSTPLLPLLLLLHIEGKLVYFYFPIRLFGTSTTYLNGLFLLPHTSPRRIQQLIPLRANKGSEP